MVKPAEQLDRTSLCLRRARITGITGATRHVPTHWKPSCFVKPSMGHRLGPQASGLACMGQFPHRTSELKIKRTGKVGVIPENSDSILCTHAGTYNHL